MPRDDVIACLRRHESEIRAEGATSLYLYGSVLRDAETLDSDVDLFIDYDAASGFSLIELIRLQRRLGDLLGRPVDLTTRQGLHPVIRGRVVEEARRVF
jgi:uncharacterized protein